MAKILRARTAGKQPTIPRSTSTSQAIAKPKNLLSPSVPMFKGARDKVRVLFQPDPNGYNKNSTKTVPTFSSVTQQFTSNPNFDPSKAPGRVTELAVSRATQTAGKASRGHQKVIAFSQNIKNGGKTLRRR